jgi:hypothetical protein
LTGFVAKYPVIAAVVAYVGIARLIFKPLMTFLKEVVAVTPSTKDDELLAKAESSKAYSMLVFALDYFSSIKLSK